MALSGLQIATEYQTLIGQLAAENNGWYEYKIPNSPAGKQLLALPPEQQAAFVLAALDWVKHIESQCRPADLATRQKAWAVRVVAMTLLRHKLPFRREDVLKLLDWSRQQENNGMRELAQMAKVLEDFLKTQPLDEEIQHTVTQLVAAADGYSSAGIRKSIARLRELGAQTIKELPLSPTEIWSATVLDDLQALAGPQAVAWNALLHTCSQASGSAPTAKWLKAAQPTLDALGFAAFKQAVLKWFSLVDQTRVVEPENGVVFPTSITLHIAEVNTDILKGLVWLCAQQEDQELARALTALAVSAYRKIPGVGPRCVRVGNACIWALGNMPGNEGVAQLALLKLKLKGNAPQKVIASALMTAAKRLGLAPEEIEELSVPTYGLQEAGLRREQFGEYAAELLVAGTHEVELNWFKGDGKKLSAAPKAVKEQFPAELKELTQAAKEIARMLPAQRDRLENLYLEQKSWPFAIWRARYLDHPLLGELARRIIWQFTRGEQRASGLRHAGRIIDVSENTLDWLDDETQVSLWHPLNEDTATVLAWRNLLAELEISQPFKQAHREIYLLTDAERTTHNYSNRFAAHIIKQHQFNALCSARGWKNQLRLMVDDSYTPPTRWLPVYGLRAEFWVESIGNEYGQDTNQSGTFLYLTTDQVRFYSTDARQHYSHAYGGGYVLGNWFGNRTGQQGYEPLPLEQIPPLVFSEIMRDVDLFVGVASVANDPAWADGGGENRHREYWSHFSFGGLSETAKTRKQVLERVIPRLKIAERCHFSDRFLVVRGDLRTYKIHLGSGNILMEPNDQYLCIVQSRGTADDRSNKVFLPFEGDNTLAVILSKALLLAEDTKIKDPSITRQIR